MDLKQQPFACNRSDSAPETSGGASLQTAPSGSGRTVHAFNTGKRLNMLETFCYVCLADQLKMTSSLVDVVYSELLMFVCTVCVSAMRSAAICRFVSVWYFVGGRECI